MSFNHCRCYSGCMCCFFSLSDLILTHYGFVILSSQLRSTASGESLNALTKWWPPTYVVPAICQRSVPPSQRGGRAMLQKKSTATHTQTTSVLHQNRNSLAWNINLPRKRHHESETSSNLMQEKTAIWLGCENLKWGEGRDLPLSLHPSFLPSPTKCRPLK